MRTHQNSGQDSTGLINTNHALSRVSSQSSNFKQWGREANIGAQRLGKKNENQFVNAATYNTGEKMLVTLTVLWQAF